MLRSPAEWAEVCRAVTSGYVPGGKRQAAGLYEHGCKYVREHLKPLGLWKPGDVVLDVGAANGRVAMGLLEEGVYYHGLEIVAGCVEFCKMAFAPWPDFHFHHLDVANARYNPEGRGDPGRAAFPLPDASVDVAIAASLFTHLGPLAVAARYLDEIYRVLAPGGRLFCTWLRSPPNEPTESTDRTVYREADIVDLLEGWTLLHTSRGLSARPHDQWTLVLSKSHPRETMHYILAPDVQNVVVSAQRSGTTWLQALLGAYLCTCYGLPDGNLMKAQDLTRMAGLPVTAFTHDPQRESPDSPPVEQEYAGKRIALLVRDPLDTLLSQFMLARHRRRTVVPESLARDFILEKLPGLLAFYEAWLGAEKSAFAGFEVYTYEALHQDASGELGRLARFFGYADNREARWAAVEFADFEHMQALEKAGQFHEHYLVNDFLPVEDNRAMRTRRGRMGRGRRALPEGFLEPAESLIAASPHMGALYARAAADWHLRKTGPISG
jgi:SAM-dependent methyltransferase